VDSISLIILQQKLLKEYEDVIFQEETLSFQKSREKWVRLGSRNTPFFHTQTIIRRNKNKIHAITLPSRENGVQTKVVNSDRT